MPLCTEPRFKVMNADTGPLEPLFSALPISKLFTACVKLRRVGMLEACSFNPKLDARLHDTFKLGNPGHPNGCRQRKLDQRLRAT